VSDAEAELAPSIENATLDVVGRRRTSSQTVLLKTMNAWNFAF
jgi:hypothetical protein